MDAAFFVFSPSRPWVLSSNPAQQPVTAGMIPWLQCTQRLQCLFQAQEGIPDPHQEQGTQMWPPDP